MVYADLHVHSHHSDGTDSPAELVARAKRNGIQALALTDHDMVTGVADMRDCARQAGLDTIPGVEISTACGGVQLHVLGYCIDCSNRELSELLSYITRLRAENTRQIFENLCQLKAFDFTWQQVLEYNRGKSWLGSTDVFRAMQSLGHYEWEQGQDFYDRYFGPNSPAYVELGGVTAIDAVGVITAAGGVPVIAHPKLIGDDSQIMPLIRHGLMGIEAYYPAHTAEDVKRYTTMARSYNLLVTGGTDWHGRFTHWDTDIGQRGVDQDLFNQLKARA